MKTDRISQLLQEMIDELARSTQSKLKPEEPWTLPREIPGFRALRDGEEWHRNDFTKEMLEGGWRPCLKGEDITGGHVEVMWEYLKKWRIEKGSFDNPEEFESHFFRTKRPFPILTAAQVAEGWKEWHGGENPAPGKRVSVLFRDNDTTAHTEKSGYFTWGQYNMSGDIIAYRITDVPLGPEDVPPGSVFRPISWGDGTGTYITVASVRKMAVCVDCRDFHKDECDQANGTAASWTVLMDKWRINRSIPLLGKWDATAWEPCHKEAPEPTT